MIKTMQALIIAFLFATASLAYADLTVPLHFTAEQGIGPAVGSVTISETKYGLLFTPHLEGLTPGIHGFHIHEHPSCDNKGMAAGGHFDPTHSGKHLGPYNDKGHLGDLPVLYFTANGSTSLPVLAPRLKHLSEIKQHALMVHNGGDNYSDVPEALGGGDGRMACAVIS